MGIRYVGYRLFHEFEKRTGILKKKHPINPEIKKFISLEEWKSVPNNFIIEEREKITLTKNPTGSLAKKAKNILAGKLCFFNHEWKDLGKDYDWVTNPTTGFKYDIIKHWSEIDDFDSDNGDIKDVWEKSRFTFLLNLIRYDHHFNEDHSEFAFSQIEDWIEKNPVNRGPNWKCSQEISLRLFNWNYALSFYKNSPALSNQRWEKIQNVIYWSLHHVYHHINFSRIAVRNNHAITETLCLSLSEMLFPFIPETKIWAKRGRKWFEQEIPYQIYKDGTFLQFSMNYHRVVIQLFSLGIAVSEKHQKPFSSIIYERAYKSLNFLYQCVQEENGFVPNYGNNDGALFFPLSETAYRDYRPQLNTLHYLLSGENLYTSAQVREDANWLIPINLNTKLFKPLKINFGALSFPNGGFYTLREKDSFTFVRCGNHKDRPAQADNLHLDIWYKGENVLRDSGTYKYNTKKEYQEYFSGTAGHNTVMIGNNSQMLKGSRFIWFYWSQANIAQWEVKDDQFIFTGEISAFKQLHPNIKHKRTIIKEKNSLIWKVKDEVNGNFEAECRQLWHLGSSESSIQLINKKAPPIEIPSYNSSFYGEMKKTKGLAFGFKNELTTTIKI
ncbi:alginate lyase family protein [Gillisia sp. Hel_I_86]|uniref:alginate lyase family protein n=1 Tax=Gillisia sp. Hel_I_86 TaxID=1249981 RepID=UPI0011AB0F0A|nr:alginate lyase family protein [Gillisia sp. Hel_I_86]